MNPLQWIHSDISVGINNLTESIDSNMINSNDIARCLCMINKYQQSVITHLSVDTNHARIVNIDIANTYSRSRFHESNSCQKLYETYH